jgi:hypothetical protein
VANDVYRDRCTGHGHAELGAKRILDIGRRRTRNIHYHARQVNDAFVANIVTMKASFGGHLFGG